VNRNGALRLRIHLPALLLAVRLTFGAFLFSPAAGADAGDPGRQSRPGFISGAKPRNGASFAPGAEWGSAALGPMVRAGRNNEEEAERLLSLGALFWDEGRIDRSAEYYSRALDLANNRAWAGTAAFCEGALAVIGLYESGKSHRRAQRLDEAERHFLRAVDLSRKIKSIPHEVKCLRQLSIVHYYRLGWDQYYSANKEAYDLADRNHLMREKAHCAFNLGFYRLKTGGFHAAHVMFSRAGDIYRRLDSIEDEVECDHNIGLVYYEVGDYDRALKKMDGLAEKTADEDMRAAIWISMGNARKKKTQLDGARRGLYEAAAYYRRALDVAIRSGNAFLETAALNNLGYLYYEADNPALALSYFRCGRRASERTPHLDLKCTVTANLANVYFKMGDYRSAEKHYAQALRDVPPGGFPAALWEVFYGLGRCHMSSGREKEALSCALKAVDLIESAAGNIESEQDRGNVMFNKHQVYESAIRLVYDEYLRSSGDFGPGLRVLSLLDRFKSRTLLDALLKENGRTPLDRPSGQAAPKAAGVLPGLTADDLLRCFGRETAVVMYSIGDSLSLAVIVARGKIDCFRLPDRISLEDAAARYWKLLSAPPPGTFPGYRAAHRLYKEILAPGLRRLPEGIKNIVFVPDGALNFLPFEALVMEIKADKSGVYLMDRYNISYAPSLSVLCRLLGAGSRAGQGPEGVLFVGKSDYGEYADVSDEDEYLSSLREGYLKNGVAFAPLRGVIHEAEFISSSLKKSKTTVLLNGAANEAAVKSIGLSRYRVVHFACHGLVDEDFPLRSSLVLSRNDVFGEDGFLQVPEIAGLGLRADLVVLSACRTGRGKLSRGEGVLGLARTFFYGGARSVLSALWNVDDGSTAVFMKYLYENLSNGLPKNEALRRAKQKMRRSEYSHPYFWAPFVLSGDFKSSCGLN